MTKFALVGDVGGTNARLALCDLASGEISQAKTYSGLDYPSLEAVVRVYLDEHNVSVEDGCIAIACPITGDWVAMTNHTWQFSIAEMKKNLGFSHLEIINDFTAVSMAIPMLKKEHLIQFGGTEPVEGKPIAVYGAGTGLGVAHLVHVDKRWVSLPGEGGHVDFAPNSEEEGIILEVLREEIGHVSAERVLSGPGLVNLYRAHREGKGPHVVNALTTEQPPYAVSFFGQIVKAVVAFAANIQLHILRHDDGVGFKDRFIPDGIEGYSGRSDKVLGA